MQSGPRIWVTLVGHVLVVLLVCAACTPTQTAPNQAPSAAEKEIVVVQGTEPLTLDMTQVTAQAAVNVGQHYAETLLEYDEKFQLKPSLAIEWKRIGPTTWQYKLRPGVKFTNGEAFNAEQVKWNVERVIAPTSKSLRKGDVAPLIANVQVVDDLTVNFNTNGPIPLFDLLFLKFPFAPEGYVTAKGDEVMGREPIGTGPFIFQEWVKDDHITLRRNPDYWGDKAKADKLTFRTVPDVTSRVATLLAREADIVTDLQPTLLPEIEKRSNLSVVKRPEMRDMYLVLNTAVPSPLQNIKVRQALNYAVDKDALVKSILGGYAAVLNGQMISSEYWGYDPNMKPYPYDPATAKQLLAEAGYANGFTIRMACPRGRYMNDAEICQAIAGQLKNVGITLNAVITDFGAFSKDFYSTPPRTGGPVFFIGYLAQPDAAAMFTIFGSTHPNNQHPSAELDKRLSEIQSEGDNDKRLQLVRSMSQFIYNEAPVVFLYQQYLLIGVNKRVQNFTAFPDGRVNFRSVDVSGSR